jgi:RNase adapter protein RapZ
MGLCRQMASFAGLFQFAEKDLGGIQRGLVLVAGQQPGGEGKCLFPGLSQPTEYNCWRGLHRYNFGVDGNELRLVVITGMSGAGKTTALRCFEDLRHCCVDNLPPMLIDTFLQLFGQTNEYTSDIAVVCDVRSGELFKAFKQTIETLQQKVSRLDVLFIDCDDRMLVTRFNETRRIPPLGLGMRVEDAVRMERHLLDPIKELATHVIDSSNSTPHQLRDRVMSIYSADKSQPLMSVSVLSFGFKYGIPADADFVFDTRFMANPFYVDHLRSLTGHDQPVVDFVMGSSGVHEFLDDVLQTLSHALGSYQQVHKFNVVVAFACTGGKHRSVCIANEVARRLQEQRYRVAVQHRDIERL